MAWDFSVQDLGIKTIKFATFLKWWRFKVERFKLQEADREKLCVCKKTMLYHCSWLHVVLVMNTHKWKAAVPSLMSSDESCACGWYRKWAVKRSLSDEKDAHRKPPTHYARFTLCLRYVQILYCSPPTQSSGKGDVSNVETVASYIWPEKGGKRYDTVLAKPLIWQW